MKLTQAMNKTVLIMLFGVAIPLLAQHEDKGGQRPEARQGTGEQRQPQQPARQEQQRQSQQPARQQQSQAVQQQPRAQQPQQQQQQQQKPSPVREPRAQADQQRPRQQQIQQQQTRQQPAQAQRMQDRSQQQQGRQEQFHGGQQAQQQPQRSQEQARSWQQQKGWAQRGGGSVGHATFQQSRAQHWDSDHRSWAQRGGYGGYYIPQDRFQLSFGIGHFFRLRSMPVMYMGYPRFEYGGFSFIMVDPWPEYWGGNWYDADDMYIGYDDGYYLYNRRYPSAGIAISIVM